MPQSALKLKSREVRNPVAAVFILLPAILLAGCANPGPPKPPSLHLPMVVKDLQAERVADQVLLRWTTPSRTTDDMEIKGGAGTRGEMTAELCREVGDRPTTPAARAAACAPVRRLTVAPGPSQVGDLLPPALQAEPLTLLTYRIQIFNASGHSAGNSAGAFTAAGPAPPPLQSLRATASESGAILEWQASAETAAAADLVDLTRVDVSMPSGPKHKPEKPSLAKGKSNKPQKPDQMSPNQLHLRSTTTATHGATAGTVDSTAVMGDTYTYVAERVRTVTIGGRALELHSAPSATVTLAMHDTFPPRPPVGLAAISGTTEAGPEPYIDLSWEANAEPDLAGYRVYRQLARPDGSPQGPLARLVAVPLAAPAYRDVAVRPGQGYIYTVTAVDAAGNESAPSAKALETISPQSGGSPH